MESENTAEIKRQYENFGLQYYTKGEEIANTVTHGIGAVLALAGMIYMLVISYNWLTSLTAVFFCLPAFVVYANSTIYHSLTNLKLKSVWRKIDHANISFIVIACSVPLFLYLSKSPISFVALVVCLCIAGLNIVLCIKNLIKFKTWALVLDFVIGAVAMAVVVANLGLIPLNVKIMYAVAVVICCLGAALYGIKIKYMHAVFHVFVMAGPAIMYFAALKLFGV